MNDILSAIVSTATGLVDGIDLIKDSVGMIFNLFPSDLSSLLIWGVGFLIVVSCIKFVRG